MENDFLTILNSPTSKIVRKRSIFYGFMKHVCDKAQVENFLDSIKTSNKQAKHNVLAYVLHSSNLAYCNDDGEPSKTAGEPILKIIKKNNVFDVCVVVTRYFGGVKLGTGGLVEAYSSACKVLFEDAIFAKCCFCVLLEIKVFYDVYSNLNYVLKVYCAKIVEVFFETKVKVTCWIELNFLEQLKSVLYRKIGDKFDLKIVEKDWKRFEIPQNELVKFKLRGK